MRRATLRLDMVCRVFSVYRFINYGERDGPGLFDHQFFSNSLFASIIGGKSESEVRGEEGSPQLQHFAIARRAAIRTDAAPIQGPTHRARPTKARPELRE